MKRASTVLITGGCGYLGSQLIRDLFEKKEPPDLKVRILDSMNSGSHRALMNLPEEGNYQFLEGDILNPAIIEKALEDVDAVVHLAAIVHTPMGYENPTWVEQVNYWGTSRLVEACLDAGISQFIYASSIAVYGPMSSADDVASESDVCKPVGPYAHSKHNAEHSILTAHERGLDSIILRFGILYGYAPTTRFDAVANRFAYLAGVRRPLTIHGTGEQKRSFVHVRDASQAVCSLLKGDLKADQEKIINIVGQNASVLEVARAVKEVQPNAGVRYTDQDVQTHFNLVADNSRVINLGWQPQYSLVEGMSELVDRIGPFQSLSMSGILG